VILRTPYVSKPNPGALVDPTHPLAQGLVGFYALAEGAGTPVDVVTGVRGTSNSAAWSSGPGGACLSYNGTSQYTDVAPDAALSVVGPITVASYCAPTAGTTNQHIIDCRGTAGGYYLVANSGGTNEFGLFVPNTVSASSANAIDGGWHVLSAVMSSTNAGGIQFYRDGQAWGTATFNAMPAAPTGTVTRKIATNTTAGGAWFKGPIGWIGVWARALSAADNQALAANPWAMFLRPVVRLPRAASGAASRVRRTLFDRAGSRGVS
jgi:hypothetical protein